MKKRGFVCCKEWGKARGDSFKAKNLFFSSLNRDGRWRKFQASLCHCYPIFHSGMQSRSLFNVAEVIRVMKGPKKWAGAKKLTIQSLNLQYTTEAGR